MTQINADNLLSQVAFISQKYDEIAEITGENYNIFEILDVNTLEDKHSRILTDILNPKGLHDCGNIFLKLFFEKFLLKETKANNFDFSKFQVHREYYAKDFGRIDIFINCKDFGIVIENKIHAGDQPEQLKRYDEFLKREFKRKSHIFYLTLNGNKASDYSSEGVEYKTLSYAKDILDWLKSCQKEVYNKPIIRETLEQYINLIKILTNQTRSEKMSEEIANTITSSAENMKSAFEIGKNLQKAKEKIFNERLREPLAKNVKNNNGLDYFESGGGFVVKFKKPNWEFHIHIGLCENSSNLLYGAIGSNVDSIKEKFENCGFKYHDYRNLYGVCNLLKEFYLAENIFAELCKPENKVLEEFEKKIEEVVGLLRGVK